MAEWFSKGYSAYGTSATDDDYYLGLGKAAVGKASTDLLGAKLLEKPAMLSWDQVAQETRPPLTSALQPHTITTPAHNHCL